MNNVGKYRAFKSVPLPFNYDEEEDKDEWFGDLAGTEITEQQESPSQYYVYHQTL